jgi:hypothetical protein
MSVIDFIGEDSDMENESNVNGNTSDKSKNKREMYKNHILQSMSKLSVSAPARLGISNPMMKLKGVSLPCLKNVPEFSANAVD